MDIGGLIHDLSLENFFRYNGSVEITFSSHARCRMDERTITEEEIRLTLESPQKKSAENDTLVAMRLRSNGHLLIVIYRGNGSTCHVVTVIDTSKVHKYL